MTTVDEAAREGSCPAPPEAAESTAQTRAYAREDTPQTASVAFDAAARAAAAMRRGATFAAAAAARKGTLADAQPKTFRQSRDWHHHCAGRYEALLVRWPRLWWGYAHLLVVKPALNFAEWLTESPLRWFVALAVMAVIWFGS